MPHLTDKLVKALRPRAERFEVADDEVAGFRVRVGPSGVAFHLRYRSRTGQQRNPRLGTYPALSVAAAREIAREWYGEIRSGGDPSATRKQERDADSVAEIAKRWLEESVDPKRKPRTAASYRTLLRLHIEPEIGSHKIADLARADVERLHTKIGKRVGKGAANRSLAVLSALCTFAERRGARPQRSNPCHGVERFAERQLGHYLDAAELARLDAVLTAAETARRGSTRGEDPHYVSPGAVAAIRLLMLTGCRLGEIVGLTWAHVDLAHGVLVFEDTKTGRSIRPLSPPAVALLRRMKPSGRIAGLVCVSETGGAVMTVQRAWRALRARARLDDVRIHDLRHSAASTAIEAGAPLELVGAMLGHRSVITTQRYRHIADAALRETAQRLGDAQADKLRRGRIENAAEAARVVVLPRAGGPSAGSRRRQR